MKKIITVIIILSTITFIIFNYNNGEAYGENSKGVNNQKSIASKIIRFHVLANSDSNEDQALKLKVRDKVLAFIAPKMSSSKDINESRNILKKYNNEIQEISQEVVRENGYNYSVKTELNEDYFPIKTYGDITLPQGSYEAYRILIGSAKGHNWWCVMFPPLCFTDITKGNVEVEKTQNEMKKVLTKEEYDTVDNSKIDQNKIVVKFKLKEEIDKFIVCVKDKFKKE
ncbi:stage II sporulation protein R [Clostridium acidisoli DSM 12555]|uniref:Stage II sporulation protein R n=1 Tax=Clostridium acidisoli DSM 12555 TaxID=1121291 RepID=A0A1W1XYW7_9CLOT|nr:stage II sporulation protein R [Clostridium acidisoli]SMC29065.1 stage II sporulation protein R [Clostridium acidisoli DSM 12555]